MWAEKHFKNRTNKIAALIFIILLGIFVVVRFDFYYELNDDMLMKDIISGIYTGRPDGHNIQMLFPISWLLSLFYVIIRQVTWYGLFFILCHFGCLYLIAERSLKYFNKVQSKVLALLTEGVIVCAFLLYELVFIQYTVTAAILGATAAFLLYTTEEGLSWREFFKKNIVSILLVILAFQIREEMLLLIFPLICVVGVLKWSREANIFSLECFWKYLFVIGTILLGMLMSAGIHRIAYGNAEWKNFQSFFDSRTDIYDFYGIPPYEENKAFYDSLGMQESEQELLENYNFGLSEHINEQTMEKIAEYAKQNKAASTDFGTRFRKMIEDYKYTVLQEKSNVFWHQLILIMYAAIIVMAVSNRKKSFLWKVPLLLSSYSALWLYLLYRGRFVDRVHHSLYLTEFLILAAILLELYAEGKNKNRDKGQWLTFGMVVVILFVFSGKTLFVSIDSVTGKMKEREKVNPEYAALQTYCKENEENFYFLDIYSTVKYSEKVFGNSDHTIRNYGFLGGWACRSPLDRQKIGTFGMKSIEAGVLHQDNVYVTASVNRPITWLQQYLQEEGNDVTIERTDVIIESGIEVFYVYQVEFGG